MKFDWLDRGPKSVAFPIDLTLLWVGTVDGSSMFTSIIKSASWEFYSNLVMWECIYEGVRGTFSIGLTQYVFHGILSEPVLPCFKGRGSSR